MYLTDFNPAARIAELEAEATSLKAYLNEGAGLINEGKDLIAELIAANEKMEAQAKADAERIERQRRAAQAMADALESITEMQRRNYGNGTGTHLALTALCEDAATALQAWKEIDG